ncbi:MAG: hypothetical protein ABI659_03780 [Nitrosospira sp.]
MTDHADPISRIMEEVALKHGILLDRDDPVLMVYTINQHLMEASAKVQQALLDQYRIELEANMRLWEAQAGRQADKTVRVAPEYTLERISAAIRSEVESALKQLKADSRTHQRGVNLNLFASVLTLAAAAVVLIVALAL